ncbi:hypothetical protein EMPS_05466 [Entomortierella parvispora]|uniref:Zn(2)-C6 fungal-type domain-containing protein n=1 Tax=Entomortierella parvispora TaxID=205924 RepID=A0A9P3HAW1_9FUNG|nr:hypothetical protein EMPS_05466 [Entomortierella parvispora]
MLILARLLRSVANDQERMVEVTKQILSVKGRNDDHGVDDVGGNGDDGHHSSGSSSSSSSSKGDTGGNIQDVVLVARVALQLDLDPDSDSTVSGRTRTFRSSSSRKEYSGLPDVLPPPPPSLTTAGYQALPPISDFPLLSAKSLRILQSHNKGKPSNGSGVKKKRFAGGAKSHGGGGGGGETFSSRRGSLDTGSLGTAHKRRASSTGSSVGDDADFSPSQEDNSRGARSFQKTTTTRSGREAVVQGSQDVVMTSTSDNNNAGVAKDHATPLATRTIPGLRPTSKHTPVPKSNPTYAAPASKTPPAKRARRGSTSEPASRASATPVSEISETAVVAEGTPDTNGETSDPDFEPDTCLQCIRAKTRCHGCQRTRKNTWSRCIRCVRHGIRCDPVVAAVAYALDPTLPPMSSLKAPNAVGSMGHTAVAAAASASVVSPIDTMGNVDSTVPTDAAAAMPHSAIADSLDKRRPCTHCKSVRVKCEYLNRRDDGSKDLCRRCIRLHLECVSSDRSRPKDMNPSEVLAPVDLERIKEELWKAGGPSGVDPRDLLPPSVVAAAGPLLSNNLDGEDYQIGKKRQLAFPDGISKANILQHRPRRAAATTATATAGSPPMPRKTSSAAPTRARSEQSGRSKSISSSSTDADLPLENRGAATTITTRAAAPDTTVKDPRSDGDLNISVLAVTGEPDEIVPSARD